MKRSFLIGDIKIGGDERPLVIPEIGINHGGNLETAKQMVDAACRAGARLIKHQTRCAMQPEKWFPGTAGIPFMISWPAAPCLRMKSMSL